MLGVIPLYHLDNTFSENRNAQVSLIQFHTSSRSNSVMDAPIAMSTKARNIRYLTDQYQKFLVNSKFKIQRRSGKFSIPSTQKKMTAEQKRDFMRKQGIFVEADNEENTPTYMEKVDAMSRPYVCSKEERSLQWKDGRKPQIKTETSSRTQNMMKKISLSEKDISLEITTTETSLKTNSARRKKKRLKSRNKRRLLYQESDFGRIKEDVNLVQVVKHCEIQKNVKEAESEKNVQAAMDILKIASRDNVIEKSTTLEEKEMVGNFLSGHLPSNPDVLRVIDKLLEAILKHVENGLDSSSSLRKTIADNRDVIKTALYQALLCFPNYWPSCWLAQEQENRHWLLGCLIGPANSQPFPDGMQNDKTKVSIEKNGSDQRCIVEDNNMRRGTTKQK